MKVQILFFGATAEEVGKRKIEIDLESRTKAAAVLEQVLSAHPNLQKHTLLFAVNQEYSGGDKIIKDGDEIAIFTAVSGG